ncbi:MAG: hypothetical protein HKL90_15470 [Elusimicrobia bacterium]|nr:hypothetical protein [Elusimicrobiota bacterium]
MLLDAPASLTPADLPALLLNGLGPMGASFYLWDRAMENGDPRAVGRAHDRGKNAVTRRCGRTVHSWIAGLARFGIQG